MRAEPTEPVLVPAHPDDADALGRLAAEAQGTWGIPLATLRAWGEVIEPDAAFFQTYSAWILLQGSTRLGWGAWLGWGRRCRLEHLWIDPGMHRRGYGRLLLAELAARARVRGWRSFEIIGAPPARAFYRACGAEWIGPLTHHPERTLDVWHFPFPPGRRIDGLEAATPS